MIYLCVGRRELGKTTLALFLTREQRPRVIIDPRHLVIADADQPRLESAPAVRRWFDQLREPATERRSLACIVTPSEGMESVFRFTMGECRAWVQQEQPLALVIDESTFVDLSIEPFEWLIRCSPRHSTVIVLTQHRPFDIPPRIRSIVDKWCVFRTTEPNDLAVLRERCSKDFAEHAQRLEPRQFLVWDDTVPDHNMRLYADPKQWHVPTRANAPHAPRAEPLASLPTHETRKNILPFPDESVS